jgi:hypothetical protein
MDLMAMGPSIHGLRRGERITGQSSGWWYHLRNVVAWVSLILASIALAQVTSSVVANGLLRADEAQPPLSRRCEGGGQVLYIGLNSWIPAQACLAPSGEPFP